MSSFRIFTPTCKNNYINNSDFTTLTLILSQNLKNTCSVFINVTAFGMTEPGMPVLCERTFDLEKTYDGIFSGSPIQSYFRKYIGKNLIELNIPKLTKCKISISIIDSDESIDSLAKFQAEIDKNDPSVDIYVKSIDTLGDRQNEVVNISDIYKIDFDEGPVEQCEVGTTIYSKQLFGHSFFRTRNEARLQSLVDDLKTVNALSFYPYAIV